MDCVPWLVPEDAGLLGDLVGAVDAAASVGAAEMAGPVGATGIAGSVGAAEAMVSVGAAEATAWDWESPGSEDDELPSPPPPQAANISVIAANAATGNGPCRNFLRDSNINS